ncbi:TPA: hypothetical protein DD449_03255 [Candidatus Berkelbacteria bacterium]|uniref:PaaX family transcriptional regulator, phenylacetic acid degradation operon negative regulatory protein n=1 Tax=Berkelbacteria bacterium GW2011_GWE1_39_12 TaxID=1618337 RepID=A0A0G4B520_9BACT|nr:MAG: PaaX family transcriptional regulator, phenylacetic acid degradation operon negative regulatory protein [Berkelbacteria bacterium GW2011_GWE1_39_12]HBO60676.1 hypothetical protein [Candidatus Berkelbacteria bacterium]
MDKPLDFKLLTYIGYNLKHKHVFSYLEAQKVLDEVFGEKYELTTLRKEFSILKKKELITFATHYRKPYPILTSQGKMAIKTVLPFKKYGTWDKKWRVVIFDIPEKDRAMRVKLTEKLESLGFGQIKNSTYISPHLLLSPISRYATNLGIRKYLSLMTVDNLQDEEKIVKESWKLTNINRRYEHFLVSAMKKQVEEYWPLYAKKLEHQFADIYRIDPQLPEEFLPTEYLGTDAYKKFKEISNSY